MGAINFTNANIPLVVNEEIVEWDIRSANISILREFGITPERILQRFEKQSKKKRVAYIGKYMTSHRDQLTAMEDAYGDVIRTFISNNGLEDSDILAISRDAVFVKNRRIPFPTIGEHIEFVPKNHYHSLVGLPRYRFYVADDRIDVKGISDTVLPKHENGILLFIREVLSSYSDLNALNTYLRDFSKAYKLKELDFDMYREFNTESTFNIKTDDMSMKLDYITEELMMYLDISFNYIHIYLPVLELMGR